MAKINTSNAKAARIDAFTSIDDCVRAVTGFSSFADLKDTQPTYYPKWYGKAADRFERRAQIRVRNAWNAWAQRNGRLARSFIADRSAL